MGSLITLKHASRILLVGPSPTNTHLIRHTLKHELDIEQKIVGNKTLQSPDPKELHLSIEPFQDVG
jgi:hypothetical protein